MDDFFLIWGVRLAGVFHFATLALALRTPIPPNWDDNLNRLPQIHRRFAIAQNVAIGAVIAVLGAVCLFLAPELVGGSATARAWCAVIALWWGGRAVILPWLGVNPALTTPWWRFGYRLLVLECLIYAVVFGWLSLRPLA